MKVSIIIPIYNSESKLRRCLDSVLRQEFHDYECIMVDDGSIDKSGVIIDEYAAKDNRFKTIHKPNGGVSLARNKGLEIAQGEWIVFLDSDDYLETNHLQKLMSAASDDIDMVLTGYLKVAKEETTEHSYASGRYLEMDAMARFIIESDFLEHQQPWDRMYRNLRYENDNVNGIILQFDEKLSLSEDRLYCYQYLMNCRGISVIDSVTYIHDVTDEKSLSYKKYSSEMNKYRYSMFKMMNKKIVKRFGLHSKKTKLFFSSYMEGIYACLINAYKDEGKSLKYYRTRFFYKLGLL